MAIKLSFLNSLHDDTPRNNGDLVYDTNAHEIKVQVNDTLDYINTDSNINMWQSGTWNSGAWQEPAQFDRGNVNVECDSSGVVNYTVEHNYTTLSTDMRPREGDILTASDSGLHWAPSQFRLNVYSLFDNDHMYINEDGEIFVDGKRETNTSKIGMALLKAIDSKSNKKINSIDDLE